MTYVHGGDIYSPAPNGKKWIDFSANINPLGMPERVKKALVDNLNSYSSYPDPFCRELRQAISESENVPVSMIECGNGAADLIFRLIYAIKPKKALLLAPTFAEYETALSAVDCELSFFYLSADHNFLWNEELLKLIPGTDIVILCNPNNPTGMAAQRELLLKVAEQCRKYQSFLLVDECFMDFVREQEQYTFQNDLKRYPCVAVLKAFTKLYAMAGLRLGYLLCADTVLLQRLKNYGQPWSVSTVAEKCGVAALSCQEYVIRSLSLIEQERGYLSENMKRLGIRVYPSQANYLLFWCGDTNLKEKLIAFGILIRDCSDYRGLEKGYYRIAVKYHKDNEYFLHCIEKALQTQNNKGE